MNLSPEDIDSYLSQIEYEYNIRIIGAWNNGSQAWGLSNEKSDWDIGFIFTQPLTNYALISNYIETLDIDGVDISNPPINTNLLPEDIDFIGWDIKRFLELLGEDNPTALELLHSPIGYRVHHMFDLTKQYVGSHFNIIEAYNHYQSLAKHNYKRYIVEENERTRKKNSICVRAMLNANYILETHKYPNLHFPTLVEESPDSVFDYIDKQRVEQLITQCQNGNKNEDIGNPFQESLERFIDSKIQYKDHLREAHTEHGENCNPEYCNGYISNQQLDIYMKELLQSKTLFR